MSTGTKVCAVTFLLLAMTLPATAHREADIGSNPVNHAFDGDVEADEERGCRYTPLTSCSDHRGPSGNYVNVGQNGFITGSIFPAHVRVAIAGSVNLFPLGYFPFFGSALCDIEVGGDGEGFGPLDESNVDGTDDSAGQGLIVGGALTTALNTVFGAGYVDMTDGTWDDGGDSAACHGTNYAEPAFNDNDGTGCAGNMHAEDLVSGADVWSAATCDWFDTVSVGTSELECVDNIVFEPVGALIPCVVLIRNQLLSPQEATVSVICGYGGGSDSQNYGRGGGDFPGGGVPYAGNAAIAAETPECSAADAAETGFVMAYIEVSVSEGMDIQVLNGIGSEAHPCNVGPPPLGPGPGLVPCPGSLDPGVSVVPYVAGWIDWGTVQPFRLRFDQLDWEDNGTVLQADSQWGKINWFETHRDARYLNVYVAVSEDDAPTWVIQNLPLPGRAENLMPRPESTFFNLSEIGVGLGQDINTIWYSAIVEVLPQAVYAPGRLVETLVGELVSEPGDALEEGPAAAAPKAPDGFKQGAPPPGVKFRAVDLVQEAKDQCAPGAFSRSLSWLNKELKLGMKTNNGQAMTGQAVYDDVVEGAGGMYGWTLGGMVTLSKVRAERINYTSNYAKAKSEHKITTSVWDANAHVDNIPGVTEKGPAAPAAADKVDFDAWVLGEFNAKKDVQIAWRWGQKGHVAMVVGVEPQKDGTLLIRYVDDLPHQGNGNLPAKEADVEVKNILAQKRDGSWYWKGTDILFHFAVSEGLGK